MIKIVRVETFMEKAKRKAWEVKHDAEIKVKQAINYGTEHPEVAAVVVPVAIGAVKKAMKAYGIKTEEDNKRKRFWDPRRGRYAYSKRVLTRKEADYVEREFDKGRSYRDILSELGVLQQ